MRKLFIGLAAMLMAACSTMSSDSTPNDPSIVLIHVGAGGGTGFYAGYDNIIVTAAHVVTDNKQVTFDSGKEKGVSATVIYLDRDRDIAILMTDLHRRHKTFDCSPSFKPADITLVGHPLLVPNQLTRSGRTTGSDAMARNMVPIDINILPGDSGSPVFMGDRVVGIAVAVVVVGNGFISHPTGIAMMVPADEVCEAMEQAVD